MATLLSTHGMQRMTARVLATLLATEVCACLDQAFRFRPIPRKGITWLQGLPGMLEDRMRKS